MDVSWGTAAGDTVVDRGDPDLALNTRELPSRTAIRNEIEIDEGRPFAVPHEQAYCTPPR
ncbi:hypothetical protein [Streptomyces sp. 3213.3]|uniref:hypothetical protein n=1 Tax=Streptomyces sp. 3213.3 TaxID=1855348 RepID=UPI000B88BFD3|nr:hypothetical protein [Streptomyces sp. 3213.3]